MRYEASIDIDAPPATVWQVLSDVANWPQWTPTMTSVRPLASGPLAVGASVEVRQPKLLPAVWRVTDLQPGRSFTWVTRSPGLRGTADHVITTRPGGVTVTQTFTQTGLIEPLVRPFFGSTIQQYLQTEVEGLKKWCETNQPRIRSAG